MQGTSAQPRRGSQRRCDHILEALQLSWLYKLLWVPALQQESYRTTQKLWNGTRTLLHALSRMDLQTLRQTPCAQPDSLRHDNDSSNILRMLQYLLNQCRIIPRRLLMRMRNQKNISKRIFDSSNGLCQQNICHERWKADCFWNDRDWTDCLYHAVVAFEAQSTYAVIQRSTIDIKIAFQMSACPPATKFDFCKIRLWTPECPPLTESDPDWSRLSMCLVKITQIRCSPKLPISVIVLTFSQIRDTSKSPYECQCADH